MLSGAIVITGGPKQSFRRLTDLRRDLSPRNVLQKWVNSITAHRRADHRKSCASRKLAVCRKYGVSSATFYKWKAKYGGLERVGSQASEGAREREAKLKNGDARRKAGGRCPPSFRVSGERAAGAFDACS